MSHASQNAYSGWIESPSGALFASYHPPRGAQRRACPILLCDPWGSERMVMHLVYRTLARALSDEGFGVLRVDYLGTCDSSGDPFVGPQVERWIQSLKIASRWLLESTGAEKLCLMGVSIGGTIAAHFANGHPFVDGLFLWGAPNDGRSFVRELRAVRQFSKITSDRAHRHSAEGELESMGFVLNPETADELMKMAPMKAARSSGLTRVGLMHRGRSTLMKHWARYYEAVPSLWVQPESRFELSDIGPRCAEPPASVMREIVRWATDAYPASPCKPVERVALELRPSVVLEVDGKRVRETVVRFGPNRGLFGIVVSPESGPAPGQPGIVLINGGTNHRVGINRNYTEWARRWASRGRLLLRMDLRGLGDSEGDWRVDLDSLYREAAGDVRFALDYLSSRHDLKNFVCLGLCSGAYQAFHASLNDDRIDGLLLLSPLRFDPVDPKVGVRPVNQPPERSLPLAYYLGRALEPRSWRSAWAKREKMARLSRQLAQRAVARALGPARKSLAKALGRHMKPATWLAASMIQLVERGCRVYVVLVASDEFAPTFYSKLNADRYRLDSTKRFGTEIVSDTDHIFSARWSQEYLEDRLPLILDDWYGRPSPHEPDSDSDSAWALESCAKNPAATENVADSRPSDTDSISSAS